MHTTGSYVAALVVLAGAFSRFAAADAYEPDNTPATAKWLGPAPQSRSIVVAGNPDWAKVRVLDYGYLSLATGGTNTDDTIMWLYGPYQPSLLVAMDDDGGAGDYSFIHEYVRPGIYYVKVAEFGNDATIDDYTLLMNRTSAMLPSDPFESDQAATTAGTIPLDTTQWRTMHGVDHDWVTFDIPAGGRQILVVVQPSTYITPYVVMHLYKSDNTVRPYASTTGPRLSAPLGQGTYHLRIGRAGGPQFRYSLRIETQDPSPRSWTPFIGDWTGTGSWDSQSTNETFSLSISPDNGAVVLRDANDQYLGAAAWHFRHRWRIDSKQVVLTSETNGFVLGSAGQGPIDIRKQ